MDVKGAQTHALWLNYPIAERFTDAAGQLMLKSDTGDSLPLLARRYRYEGPLGKGTFAQLLRFTDTFSGTANTQVAEMLPHHVGSLLLFG